MKRLTEKHPNNKDYHLQIGLPKSTPDIVRQRELATRFQMAINKLGEYENINTSPEALAKQVGD